MSTHTTFGFGQGSYDGDACRDCRWEGPPGSGESHRRETSTPGPLYILLADGRSLPEVDRMGSRIRFSDGHQFEVTTTAANPLVYDTTCTTCTFYGDARDEETYPRPSSCTVCGGTGVNEAIPPHLIGVGSEVVKQDDSRQWFVTGVVVALERRWLVRSTSGAADWFEGKELLHAAWTLVRPVPPAHTEETP